MQLLQNDKNIQKNKRNKCNTISITMEPINNRKNSLRPTEIIKHKF